MSVATWRIAITRPRLPATDLGGHGAAIAGGRWNSPGRRAVYTSGSIALACLETLAHLNSASLPLRRYLVRIEVPDGVWAGRTMLVPANLPAAWDALPAGKASMRLGDQWLDEGRTALLQIPSVIIPEEFNFVLDPRHPDAARISAKSQREWTYDARLQG